MMVEDFLFEMGCEELPAKQLPGLINALAQGFKDVLSKSQLSFEHIDSFATPRRLAILVKNLASQQSGREIEKKGPSVAAAFNAQGEPTPALLGFAKSCGVDYTALNAQKTDKGEFLYFVSHEAGRSTISVLPELVNQVIARLPISKRMRWGSSDTEFLRPVRWVVMLFGKQIVEGTVLGLPAGRNTYGHRFHHPEAIDIPQANQYAAILSQSGYVIADFSLRRAMIDQQIHDIAKTKLGKPMVTEDLLNEVTGLVEWPVALMPHFDEQFLSVPKEALISSMQEHQKCFAVADPKGELLPYFITISNIESRDKHEVIRGNERVMKARLSDARFFYENDLKIPLAHHLERLKSVIFQAKLGTVFEKSERIANIAAYLAKQLNEDETLAHRAGMLCKADLMTQMVGEFPELQGIMGYYYALNSNEPKPVADAIHEHYDPRYAGDKLPASSLGAIVSIADKIDTLVGIFGISALPTGEKDPFGLRRAAVGVLRIIIEQKWPINVYDLLQFATQTYAVPLPNPNVVDETFAFVMERLRAFYTDQDISADVFAAVMARRPTQPYDFHCRLLAVSYFKGLPEAISLAAANKRVSNLLAKQTQEFTGKSINPSLLNSDPERELVTQLAQKKNELAPLYGKEAYRDILCSLATLRPVVDNFFDHVLVMDENEDLRNNRLAILAQLRELFLNIADIALLVDANNL